LSGGLPEDWDDKTQALIENLQSNPAKIATRKASQNRRENSAASSGCAFL
jgi:transketolase